MSMTKMQCPFFCVILLNNTALSSMCYNMSVTEFSFCVISVNTRELLST